MPAYESLDPRREAVLFENLGLQIEKDALVEFSYNIVEQFTLVAENSDRPDRQKSDGAGDVRNRCPSKPFSAKAPFAASRIA